MDQDVDAYLLHVFNYTALQNRFSLCELELKYLDMAINLKSVDCANISTCEGRTRIILRSAR